MIEVRGLTRRYGDVLAVDDLGFTVEPGTVTEFLGTNGAGKFTTMRVVLGLDRPTSGQALVDGRPFAASRGPLREVGALLDPGAAHPGRTGRQHLRVAARANGLPQRRVDEVVEQVGLDGAARRRFRGYFPGMRQRLGIAAALLGDLRVLLFDEPVNGLTSTTSAGSGPSCAGWPTRAAPCWSPATCSARCSRSPTGWW